ncbi:MAG: ABC transporter permease subunit [Opitutaceae bacterium]|nr:ABC transporter permease subunit [Opitutaceae bacterium]
MADFGINRRKRAIVAIARQVIREGMRQHVVIGFGVAYVLFVAGAGLLRTLHFGSGQLEFVTHVGLAGASIGGALCTIVLSLQYFLGELEDGTALVLFTKPVGPVDFVVGKWLGTMGLVGGYFVWVTLVLVFQLHAPGQVAAENATRLLRMEVVAAGVMEWIKCGLLCAAVQSVAAFLRTRVLATLAGFVVLIVCHTRPLLDEAAVRSGPPTVQVVIRILVRMVPDFRLFDVDWRDLGDPSAMLKAMLAPAAYGVVHLFGLLVVCGFILRRREM